MNDMDYESNDIDYDIDTEDVKNGAEDIIEIPEGDDGLEFPEMDDGLELPEMDDLIIDETEYESDLDRMLSEAMENQAEMESRNDIVYPEDLQSNRDELEQMFNDISDDEDEGNDTPEVKVLRKTLGRMNE